MYSLRRQYIKWFKLRLQITVDIFCDKYRFKICQMMIIMDTYFDVDNVVLTNIRFQDVPRETLARSKDSCIRAVNFCS